LGGHAAALYDINIDDHKVKINNDAISEKFPVGELQEHQEA
jgi:hypothetical protein